MTTPSRDCLQCHDASLVTTRCRGLCLKCYARSRKAVQAGETAWTALEQAGQALPAQKLGKTWGERFRIRQ